MCRHRPARRLFADAGSAYNDDDAHSPPRRRPLLTRIALQRACREAVSAPWRWPCPQPSRGASRRNCLHSVGQRWWLAAGEWRARHAVSPSVCLRKWGLQDRSVGGRWSFPGGDHVRPHGMCERVGFLCSLRNLRCHIFHCARIIIARSPPAERRARQCRRHRRASCRLPNRNAGHDSQQVARQATRNAPPSAHPLPSIVAWQQFIRSPHSTPMWAGGKRPHCGMKVPRMDRRGVRLLTH